MKSFKAICALFIIFSLVAFSACEDSSVRKVVISSIPVASEDVKEAPSAAAGENIYANVFLIEMPKGSEIEVKWYLSGSEIKKEKAITSSGPKSVLNLLLEGDKANPGSYTLELYYKEKLIHKENFVLE